MRERRLDKNRKGERETRRKGQIGRGQKMRRKMRIEEKEEQEN